MNCEYVEARDIDGAHFSLIRRLFRVGRIYTIERGSYEGHKRLEFDYVTFRVKYPATRPLSPTLPSCIPPVTSEQKILDYFCNYLMVPKSEDVNEEYTYGQYIMLQVEQVLAMLKKSGSGTNQATFCIGGPESIDQESPPCLRVIDCRILDGKLHFAVYFRSWDLWAGLPENLGGLQLLKETMAEECGVEDGELIASSKGLHLYDYQWPLAKLRLGSSFPVDGAVTAEEAELGEGWMQHGGE